MNLYDRYVLPRLVDLACGQVAIQAQRALIIPEASGRVLEVGLGTGRNLPFYDKQRVTELYGLEPATQMNRLARKRIEASGLPVKLISAPAERIPLPDATFDSLVMTYALCSIASPTKALREMKRVLKPDGSLLFCEHGLAPDLAVRRWQRRLTPLWRRLAGGCELDRGIPGLLIAAGFRIAKIRTMYLSGPRSFTFTFAGTAVTEP